MMWKTVEISEVARVSAGNSAPQEKELFIDGKYPFVRTSDVGKIQRGVIYESNDKLNEQGVRKLRLFEAGTILFPKSGASTFLNHRVMLGVDAYVASHLATIKADNILLLDSYLLYFLQTVDAAELVADSAYPSLTTKTISAIKLPLPPLEEQQRVVTKLDTAFTKIDKAIANTERKQIEAEALKNAVLATELDGGKDATTAWETVKLGEVCNVRRGTTITKKVAIEGKIPVIGSGTKPTYFHNEANRGPNCITISGSGNAGFVNFWEQPIFASDCSTVEPKDETQEVRFVYYYLQSMQQFIYDNFRSGTAQQHVYAKDIATINYPLVSLIEQQRIVAKLDAIFAEVDKSSALFNKIITNYQALKSTILVTELRPIEG